MNTRKMLSTNRRGFTLMEMIISLAITALLMVAMGGAFTAAGSAVTMNDQVFRSMQQGRAAQDMIATLLRRCASVSVCTASGVTFQAGSTDFGGDNLTIAFNAAGPSQNTITLTDNTAGTTSVMASNVASATFTHTSGTDINNNTQSFAVIGLTMQVAIGGNSVTLSNSAAPRVYDAALFQ